MAINKYLDINKILDLPEYPIAVLPPLIDSRIVAQKSCFTIHGRNINGFEELLKKNKDLRLVKLIIADISIKHIKYELATTGLTNTSIFPDLEGLSKDLKYEHGIK